VDCSGSETTIVLWTVKTITCLSSPHLNVIGEARPFKIAPEAIYTSSFYLDYYFSPHVVCYGVMVYLYSQFKTESDETMVFIDCDKIQSQLLILGLSPNFVTIGNKTVVLSFSVLNWLYC